MVKMPDAANYIRATTYTDRNVCTIRMHLDGKEIGWIDYNKTQLDGLVTLLKERAAELRD